MATEPAMYDLLYLVANKYTENELPAIMEIVKGLVTKFGGTIKQEVNYGKRRLAYPVKHNHYGYYILSRIEMEPKQTKELEKNLRVQDELLRFLLTHTMKEGSVPKEADLRQAVEQPKEEPRKRPSIVDVEATAAEKEKIKKGMAFDLEKELGVTAKEAEQEETEKKEETEKNRTGVDMKELDDKLDEIMKDL